MMSPKSSKPKSSNTSLVNKIKDESSFTSVSRLYKGFNLDQAEQSEVTSSFIENCLVFLSYLLVIVTLPLSLFIIFVRRNMNLCSRLSRLSRGNHTSENRKATEKYRILVVGAFTNVEIHKHPDPEQLIAVRQFERAIILRNGKLRRVKPYGPGLIQYLPCIDTLKFTDLRIICYEVPPQEALTKDALTVSVDAVVYYKIYDPLWAVVNIADYKVATQFIAATTLRNALGTRKLAEILCDRPGVGSQVFGNMKNLTINWGVKIVGFEVKDISLPLQLQKAMATEAESYRLANAKIIVAKAEIESTRNLQKATKLLMENPYCMQLRYLQALQMIAGSQTHTVVMPFAFETFQKLMK